MSGTRYENPEARKILRKLASHTRKSLAERAGMSLHTLTAYDKGRRKMTPDAKARLVGAIRELAVDWYQLAKEIEG